MTVLERYSIINKISPGLRLGYRDQDIVKLEYYGDKEGDILDLINNISTSLQRLDDAHLYLTDSIKFALSDLYDDNLSSDVTLPCQIFNLPQTQSSQQYEIMVFQPFLTLKSRFHAP